MDSLDSAIRADLDQLDTLNLRRTMRQIERLDGSRVGVGSRELLNFASNDYLGLAAHPRVIEAAAAAAREWGGGATGSRLTSGSFEIHRALEQEIAAFKGTEDAMLFSSGYAANLSIIPALVGPGDLILSDSLNHASLIDGCRLSRAEIRIYRHRDVEHARSLLADRHSFRRALLVTDTIFSMDGDLAPLPDIVALCQATDTWLMADDAHGTGVLGVSGHGAAEHCNLPGDALPIQMGTLSKGLGSSGGFVAGSASLVEWLRHRARAFMFSTAPPPAAIGAARAALQIIASDGAPRERLVRNSSFLRSGMRELGCQVPDGETPIIPVFLGDASDALRVSSALLERGVWAPAIRPPTVPQGTSRLRISVSAAHGDSDLEGALDAFAQVFAGAAP